MDQHFIKHRISIQMKKSWWSLVVLKVDVVLQGVWVLYHISNEDDEYLPLPSFWRDLINAIFLKHSKEDRLSSSHVGIRNIPSDVCYNNTKYQVQSEKKSRCKVCKKNSRRRYVKCKSTWYMFWNISMILANVWLHKLT